MLENSAARNHSFLPIIEAVDIYKARVKSAIESVTKNKSDIEEIEQQQLRKISKVREESHSLQFHVISQFAELHQIITVKEKYFLKDIREDEERILNPMEKNLREIQENLNSIQEELLRLQERMEQKDSVKFEEAVCKRRISDEVKSLSVTNGAITAEKFNHLFLLKAELIETFDSFKQEYASRGTAVAAITPMFERYLHSQYRTLDVETAHPGLEVSEDRKRVRWTETERSLPDTGKRFTDSLCVLGSEGFTSGRHYWEVEVAGSEDWSLGVAAESVERKREDDLTPETGVWSISWCGDEFDAATSPPSRLPARPIPGRVGVYLSYESGTVSFYDADTKSHLHTFTGNKFTEKLYPFFGIWDLNQWLRICSGSAPCQ
ncbi:nuclear factor 7, ovary-like [Rhinoraja longicauda]